MITFTKDIELFGAKADKNFEVVIGQVGGKPGLAIKVFITSNNIKYADDLIDETSGRIISGYYVDRTIYTMAYRTINGEWYFIKPNTIKIRMLVKEDNEKRD